MKKIKIVPLILMLIFNNAFSQEINESKSPNMEKGFYVSFQTGYSYKMSSANLASSFDMYNVSSNSGNEKFEAIYISLGQGFQAGGAIGYMFNQYMGVETAISYLWSKTYEANQNTEMKTRQYTLSSKMLRILPSIVMQAGFEKVNPYAKFGCVLGLGQVFHTYDSNILDAHTTGETEYSGGLAFGINASVGLTFKLNDKLSLFGEFNTINMSYSPSKGEFTKASENGEDILPAMRVYNREVEFVDSYEKEPYDPNNPELDYNQPRKELKFKLPYGSMGVNAGLKINF